MTEKATEKLTNKKPEENKQKINKLDKKPKKKRLTKKQKQFYSFTGFLAGLIILFFIFYEVGNYLETPTDQNRFNNYDFTYDDNQSLWFTTVQMGQQPFVIPFYYHPKDLQDIPIQRNIERVLYAKKPAQVIVAIPSNTSSKTVVAAIEISKLTGERFQVLKLPTKSAFNDRVKGFSYANCSNASMNTVVFNFEKTDANAVISQGRCIRVQYIENDSIRVADALAYKLLKIM